MQKTIAVGFAICIASTSAEAQSPAETFRQLKGTVRQLGAKPQAPRGTPSVTQAGGVDSSNSQADAEDMVPTSALADDASDTRLEDSLATSRRVENFDIRGFKLGMSPREVGRVARKAGFRRRWNSVYLLSGSFELEATRLANMQLNRPIDKSSKSYLRKTAGVDRDGSEIELSFTLEPVGPRLSEISYRTKMNGLSEAQIMDSLKKKYGPPDQGLMGPIWRNGARAIGTESANARLHPVFVESTFNLSLFASSDYINGARKKLQERAQAIANERGGSLKF